MKAINGLLKHLDKLSNDAAKGEEKDKHGDAPASIVAGNITELKILFGSRLESQRDE